MYMVTVQQALSSSYTAGASDVAVTLLFVYFKPNIKGILRF